MPQSLDAPDVPAPPAVDPDDRRELPGLASDAARTRLSVDGPNALPQPDKRSNLRIVLEVFREPMLVLLVASGAIYLAIGELKDSAILIAFAMFSVVITVLQEVRTERVLQSLRDLTSPRALVMRDGIQKRVPSEEIVCGDVIVLREGDRVPADAAVVEDSDLQADESILTGESVPVSKRSRQAADPPSARPGGNNLPYVFSGTLIVRGAGLAEVIATGPRSEIGRIGQSLSQVQSQPPRLQRETRQLAMTLGIVGGAVTLLTVLLYGLLRGNWLNAVLAGIALGMAMLPEEFPVVLVVFVAMGAWRISRVHVLARRAAAIETLGSATILCTDKTGTLTENRMSIAELQLPDGNRHRIGEGELPSEFADLVLDGVLASRRDPFDPMERAFHALGEDTDHHVPEDWSIVQTYGLRPDLLAVVQGWQAPGSDGCVVAGKGAPEAIASLCRMTPDAAARLQLVVADMANRGLRVLAVARTIHRRDDWPETPRDLAFEYAGLVGMSDPLRAGVPEAVAQCHAAGIEVVMITGDHPETARAIAAQAGVAFAAVLTGPEIDQADEAGLATLVRTTRVFARILPEQKLRIVEAFKRNGEIVAMIGDGVNDAPSLKAADIGIAMGGRGTDVAREAASLVLLDDDFASVVAAIRLGRRIYDNLRKAMGFILAVHVPVAGLALLPLISGLPVLLWPIHIAFLELIIDPVCSLVFEAEREEHDVMARPPRPPDERVFPLRLMIWSGLQGFLVLLVVSGVFVGGHALRMPDVDLRAITFFSLVASIIGLVLVNRSFSTSIGSAIGRPNLALGVVLTVVVTILAVSLLWPAAANLWGFGPLHLDDLTVVACTGIGVLLLLELLKLPWRRWLAG